MVKAKLENPSQFRRKSWVEVPVPFTDLSDEQYVFKTDGGLFLPAIKGGSHGKQTTFYRIETPFDGGQIITGEFHPLGGLPFFPPFKYSDWVADDIGALIPSWIVRIDGVDHRMLAPAINIVEQSKAHQKWHLTGRLEGKASGFVGNVWITFFNNQDDAEIKADLVWSDRNVDTGQRTVEGVGFEAGEYITIDFDTVSGHSGPHKIGGKQIVILSGPIGFADGSAFPIYGRMLCLPTDLTQLEPQMVEVTQPDTADATQFEIQERIDSLQAALEFPCVGNVIHKQFNSKWLAHKWVPEIPDAIGQSIANARYQESLAIQSVQAAGLGTPKSPLYARRKYGMSPSPGSTGDQEDFGATKGTLSVSVGDARWIWTQRYQLMGDYFRGFMHYEDDGSMLLFENHLNWRTWSGKNHYAAAQPDSLGKTNYGWGQYDAPGWFTYDDQHRSWNNWCAYLALADDDMSMDMLIHHIRLDQSMTPNRVGAPRAIGRLLLAWAHAYNLLPQEWADVVMNLMMEKINAVQSGWRGGQHGNPVKVIGAGTDPRMGVTDGNGVVLPGWVVWEHGLCAVGLYAAWKVTNHIGFRDMLEAICRTIVEYGCHKIDGKWWIANNVWYPWENEGVPVAQEVYDNFTTAPQVSLDLRQGGVVTWTIPAIHILNEILPDPDPMKSDTQEIIAQTTNPAFNMRTAEWLACVQP